MPCFLPTPAPRAMHAKDPLTGTARHDLQKLLRADACFAYRLRIGVVRTERLRELCLLVGVDTAAIVEDGDDEDAELTDALLRHKAQHDEDLDRVVDSRLKAVLVRVNEHKAAADARMAAADARMREADARLERTERMVSNMADMMDAHRAKIATLSAGLRAAGACARGV